MKKWVIVLMAALGLSVSTATAFADTAEWALLDSKGNLTVEAVSDLTDEQIYTVYVMENDTVLDGGVGEKELSGLIKLEQMTLKPKKEKLYNNVGINIKMPFKADGKIYKVIIGGGELDGEILTVVYQTGDTVNAASNTLASVNETTIEKTLKEYQNKAWSLDLDNQTYKTYSAEVHKKLVNIIKENGASAEKMELYFINACTLTKLAHCSADDFYSLLLKNQYSMDIALTNEIYSQKNSIASAFVSLKSDAAVNPINNLSDLDSLLHKSEALGLLNDSTRNNIMDILNAYNDVFGLNFNGDYKKVDAYSVVKKMVPSDKQYKSINEVKTAFDNAIASLMSVSDNSGNGGSGGTGGGGISGGKGEQISGWGTNTGGGIVPSGNYVTVDMIESLADEKIFKDIEEALWAENYIAYLKSKGIMSGDGNGYVRPNAAIKREEFLKILLEAMPDLQSDTEEQESTELTFEDVKDGEWYAQYIEKAVGFGIVKGLSPDKFGIGLQITRDDAAVMIYRAIEAQSKVLKETTEGKDFTDETSISDYAVNPIKTMQRAGIISGYETGEFRPKNFVTRAEAAKMIYSVLNNLNEL